ncbi:MAG: glycosyltransferase family 2 protein [Sulfurospirillum sp.]
MIKVTIMIPTYNQDNYIVDAINSALSQKYQDLEVIVCDDNSSDNTWQLIQQLKDKRLKIYRNQENLGRVENYRKLLYELASGDFIINLDGDDYFIDNNYIAKAVKLIEKEKLDLVFSNQIVRYTNKDKYTDMDLPVIINGKWLFLNYGKKGIHIPHMTALYKRSKAVKLNFYCKDIISSDWESILKFIINSKIGFISESTGVWRQVEGSESKSNDIDKYFVNIDQLVSVSTYAEAFFNKKEIIIWKNRIISNFLKDIPYSVMSCNIKNIINYAYHNLSITEFISFILHYRFIGKILLGKVKVKKVLAWKSRSLFITV